MTGNLAWGALVVALAVPLGVVAAMPELTLPALVALAAITVIAVLMARGKGDQAAAIVLAASLLFMRPLLFGEQLGVLGAAGAALAAFLCLPRWHLDRPARASILAATLLWWVWELALLAVHPEADASGIYRGLVTVYAPIVLAAIVLSDQRRRTIVVKAMLVMLLAVSASALVTAAIWTIVGIGAFPVGMIPFAGYEVNTIGQRLAGVPVFAPFTTLYSSQDIFGMTVPRLLGVGRESGVFAALCAVGIFVLPRVGWNRWRWRLLLVAGVLLTQSTAGFAALLIAGVVVYVMVGRRAENAATGYFKVLAGAGLLAVAAWLAITAPGIGLAAKQDLNEVSVVDRQSATLAGLSSWDQPFGAVLTGDQATNAGINLAASISQVGVLGAVLLLAGIVAPWLVSPVRRQAAGPLAVLLVTVMASQPLRFSTAFVILALMTAQRLPGDSDEGYVGEGCLQARAESDVPQVHVAAAERRVGGRVDGVH